MSKISRQAYAEMYGPTTGDRLRLGDTELWLEVEKDLTTYGDEVKFGGGKVIRDGQGQSQRKVLRGPRLCPGCHGQGDSGNDGRDQGVLTGKKTSLLHTTLSRMGVHCNVGPKKQRTC